MHTVQRYRTLTLACVLAFAHVCGSSAAQPEKIRDTVKGALDTRQATQKQAAEWHSKKERMKSQYFQIQDSLAALDLELQHIQDVVARQEVFMSRMQKKIIDMDVIRQNMVPYLEEVLSRMQLQIEQDLPFLNEERTARTSALKQLIHDPELSMGEKIRRVFEGVRIEMDYGRNVETTREEIMFEGETLMVQMLRLGRTALLLQTLDKKQVGMYVDGRWVSLPGAYRDEIRKAIEITERRRPIEFVNLPVRGALQ